MDCQCMQQQRQTRLSRGHYRERLKPSQLVEKWSIRQCLPPKSEQQSGSMLLRAGMPRQVESMVKHSSIVEVQVPSCLEGQSKGWGRGRRGGYTYWKTWPATSTWRAGQGRPEIDLCVVWCWGSNQYQLHNRSCRRHCDCTWSNSAASAWRPHWAHSRLGSLLVESNWLCEEEGYN